MRSTLIIFLIFSLILAGCNTSADSVSASGIPSPTPFQPGTDNAPDSIYAGAAPTPLSLPTPTLPPSPTPTQIIILPTSTPVVLNPLTGAPVSDPALLNRRPMAIKVANYPRYIRPQSGLSLADSIYEYYIEGGLTRFIGIFYGNNSEWVGPVRSGRFFDENIQRTFHGEVEGVSTPFTLPHYYLAAVIGK